MRNNFWYCWLKKKKIIAWYSLGLLMNDLCELSQKFEKYYNFCINNNSKKCILQWPLYLSYVIISKHSFLVKYKQLLKSPTLSEIIESRKILNKWLSVEIGRLPAPFLNRSRKFRATLRVNQIALKLAIWV